MYLPIRTSLLYLLLGIASFAPVISHWPRWWAAYYASLLVCWVVMSFTAMRQVAQKGRQPKPKFARLLHQNLDAQPVASTTDADPIREECFNTTTLVWRHGRAIQCQPLRQPSGPTAN
jgi:hypothetical protein